ncbi:MAG: LPXTG cell wall anchor domain-containing protein [Lactobacillus sp.]|nr:LPXTG cell wall anchor domain-containing protein [Lactobacillus sp.]
MFDNQDDADAVKKDIDNNAGHGQRETTAEIAQKYKDYGYDKYNLAPDAGVLSQVANATQEVNQKLPQPVIAAKNDENNNQGDSDNNVLIEKTIDKTTNHAVWTVTFNKNGGVWFTDGTLDKTGTSSFGVLISRDLTVTNLKYGTELDNLQAAPTDDSLFKSITDPNVYSTYGAKEVRIGAPGDIINSMTKSVDYSGSHGPLYAFNNYLKSQSITNNLQIDEKAYGTMFTFDPWSGAISGQDPYQYLDKNDPSKETGNSWKFIIQFETDINPASTAPFTGILAAERYVPTATKNQTNTSNDPTVRKTPVSASITMSKYNFLNNWVTYPTELGVVSNPINVSVEVDKTDNNNIDKDQVDLSYNIDKNQYKDARANTSQTSQIAKTGTSDTTLYTVEDMVFPTPQVDGQGSLDQMLKKFDSDTKTNMTNSLASYVSLSNVNASLAGKIVKYYTLYNGNNIKLMLTDWTDLQKNIDDATKTINSDLYKNLPEADKTKYETAVAQAKQLGDNATQAQVDAANKEINDALASLVDSVKTNAKTSIDNLNDAQKTTAQGNIDKATTVPDVISALNDATTLNGSMGDLINDKARSDADNIKNSTNYKDADADKKKAYDDAVEAANKITPKDGQDADNDAVVAAKKAVDDAYAALNGDANLNKKRSDAADKIDGMTDLNDAQKKDLKDQIGDETDLDKIDQIVKKGEDLNVSMGDLKKAIDKGNGVLADGDALKDVDPALVDALKKAIEEGQAIVDKNGKNATQDEVDAATKKILDAIDAATKKILDAIDAITKDAKDKAEDKIDGMTNLNDAQKEAAKKDLDNATDPSAVKNIEDKASDLNTSMGDLKKAIDKGNTIINSGNLDGVDPALVDALKKAIEEGQAIVDKNGKNASQDEVDAATKKILDAIDALTKAVKDKAKTDIDNLTNLNDAQKNAAKAEIDAETDATKVPALVDKAKTLNDSMGQLKNDPSLVNEDSIKNSPNFKSADKDKQEAYEKALNEAKEIIAKSGPNKNNDEVLAAKKALDDAAAALNGDAKLNEAKNKAKDQIDGMSNLNDKQKDSAKSKVDAATSQDQIDAEVRTAGDLNTEMGKLKKQVSIVDKLKKSKKYKNASKKKKKAYDAALAKARKLLGKNGRAADLAAVKKLIAELLKGANGLDGKGAGYKAAVSSVPSRAESNKLPQTGDNTLALAIMGALMSVGSLTAIRRRKEDK